MAGAIGAAWIRLGADISGMLAGLKTASTELSNFTYQVNTDLTQAYKKADTASKVFKNGLGRLAGDIESIGKKMSTFASLPIVFGGAAAFKEFANLEKLQIGLAQYGETLKSVKELAKLPNISVEGAAESLIQLRAVGVESELAKKGITAFANALTAAGKSSADLSPALFNITQMLSTGKISAVDLKELANRIPQTMKIIKDEFGTTDTAILNMIGPEKFVERLIGAFSKIPTVTAGAGTAMEQFQDSLKFAVGTMGEAINRAFNLTENIQKLGDWVEGATASFSKLSPGVQDAIVKFSALVAVLGPALIGFGQLIRLAPAIGAGFTLMGGPIAIVITALATFIVYYKDIIRLLEGAALKFKVFNATLKSSASTSWMASGGGMFGGSGAAEDLADGILAKNAGYRKDEEKAASQERARDRRALRAENDILRSSELAIAEAQKQSKIQADALAASLKGVGSAYKEASVSGRAYQDLLKAEQAQMDAVRAIGGGLKPLESKGMSFKGSNPELGKLAAPASTIDDTLSDLSQFESEYSRKIAEVQELTKEANAQINTSIRGAATEVSSSFGEMLGNLATGEKGMASFGSRVLSILGQLLKDIGKSLIALAVAGKALQFFKDKPALALAAGIALTAAGQAVANSAQKKVTATRFAKGGFAYREMNAIVGDNPNARFDPEMIAPYSKVDKSIRESVKESGGGGNVFIPNVTLQGQDLVIAFERAKKSRLGLIGN